MNRAIISVAVLVLLLAGSATGNDNDMDVGFLIGDMEGLIGRIYTEENTAFAGAFTQSDGGDSKYFHADRLILKPKQWKRAIQLGQVYYGVGCKVLIRGESKTGLDVRFPLGLIYPIKATRLDLGVEWVPTVEVLPGTDYQFNRQRLILPNNDIGFTLALSLTYSI